MNRTVHPSSNLSGVLNVPPDKSITHRAVFLSALAKGRSQIHHPLAAEDCLSSLTCIEALGCRIDRKKEFWEIESPGRENLRKPAEPLPCGNSGTTMRLLSGLVAGLPFETELVGDASLSKRPMDRIAVPLREMGADVVLSNGKYPPVKIKGSSRLKPIRWINSIASAQVKSCVLFAALGAAGETRYEEPVLSRDHTERMLKIAGADLKPIGRTVIVNGPAVLKPGIWKIPGDFSSAAFFIAAGLLAAKGRIELAGVNLNPTRSGLLTVLQKMGASIKIKKSDQGGEPLGDLIVEPAGPLKAFELEKKMVPSLIDEIPLLAVLAARAKGVSFLRGLSELRVKETDRLTAMTSNLSRLGVKVQELKDGLAIEGPAVFKGGTVQSFGDHRIAMAMAVAGLSAQKETVIEGAECVSISYPGFFRDLESIS